jgi:hypothetical protein
MTYATHTHISDPKRAKTLLDSIDVVLVSYKFLQDLHIRSSLSDKQANNALRTPKAFFESWFEALPIPLDSPPT